MAPRRGGKLFLRRAQVDCDLDLGGLREHVERRDGFDREPLLQLTQIAREGGRITRDVNEDGWRVFEQGVASAAG